MWWNIVTWVILGGIAGWIASSLMAGEGDQGLLTNVGVGVVGALIGGWIAQAVGGTAVTGLNIYSIIVSVLGSIVLLGVLRVFRGSRRVA